MINLINDIWLPVRRLDGQTERIAPWQLTTGHVDNPVMALDLPRPDFNGAMHEFLIGLLYTVASPGDEDEWIEQLVRPPSAETLKAKFDTVAAAFALAGDGPRFMQDLDADFGGNPVPISGLLINAAAENAIDNNTDLFVKGGTVEAVCPACAGTALYTLQTYAPAGGQGHRTSMRGGGPLTTLAWLPASISSAPVTLWHQLWLNVPSSSPGRAGDAFPWLAPTRTSANGEVVTPNDAPAALAFWGTPRRMRLDWDNTRPGRCDLCGVESTHLISHYHTRNRGANYVGWQHPLTPYYRNKDELLARHPQPGGIGYRYWPALTLSADDGAGRAEAIATALARINDGLDPPFHRTHRVDIWAYGYDMDNMKARGWYENRMPAYPLARARAEVLATLIEQWVEAAGQVRMYLTQAVKAAWFRRPGDAGGDFGAIWNALEEATSKPFFDLIAELVDKPLEAGDPATDRLKMTYRQRWLAVLQQQARRLFDTFADPESAAIDDLERIAQAHIQLQKNLHGPKLLGILSLPKPAQKAKANS